MQFLLCLFIGMTSGKQNYGKAIIETPQPGLRSKTAPCRCCSTCSLRLWLHFIFPDSRFAGTLWSCFFHAGPYASYGSLRGARPDSTRDVEAVFSADDYGILVRFQAINRGHDERGGEVMKRWITFDLDGTLMQNPFGKWVFPEVERLISAQLRREFKATEALVREHELRMRHNRTVDAYDWDDMVRHLLNELQLDLEIDMEQLVLKHSAAPKIYLLEHTVIPTLRRLKERGYSLATVTNGFYKYQFPVMKELGISEWFDEIVTPEKAGCGKPDVDILRGLRESGRIIAHVGDRLDHDVYMANKAGVASVLIYRNLPEPLRTLTPQRRAERAEMISICAEKLKAENPLAAAAPYPPEYRPAHVLYRMEELLECVE